MEAKVSARSNKKSAGGSGTADRKKSNKKKKKDKRKQSLQSLRGGEGKESDVPSPDFDSEVQAEGDNASTTPGDGQKTPVGQVTKLPLLGSQSSVSLIAQGMNTPAANRYAPPGEPACAVRTTRPPASTSSTTPTATQATRVDLAAISTTRDGVEVTVNRVASLALKRSSKYRGKGQAGGKSGNTKSSKAKDRAGGGRAGSGPNNSNSSSSGAAASRSSNSGTKASALEAAQNESLRWEFVQEDTEKERERIALYKMNRRKRYLKDAQAKGLGWAMNYTISSPTSATTTTTTPPAATAATSSASPLSEDSGVDTAFGSPANYVDFAPMHSLRPMAARRGLAEAFVEC